MNANCEILGISFDTPKENRAFAEKQKFPFRLLSDIERTVGEAYGAKKAPEDKYADFAKRLTFLIDPQGLIHKTYAVKDTTAHPEEVLADLRGAQG